MACLVAPLAVSAQEDCSFELGEWIFKECTHRVNEERFENAKLERGICEVIQDQMERVINYYGHQLASELNLSFSKEICGRLMNSPYIERGHKQMRDQIHFAIEHNTRDRLILGPQLESWAKRWITTAARDEDNNPVEFVPAEDLVQRYQEFQMGREEKEKEL